MLFSLVAWQLACQVYKRFRIGLYFCVSDILYVVCADVSVCVCVRVCVLKSDNGPVACVVL